MSWNCGGCGYLLAPYAPRIIGEPGRRYKCPKCGDEWYVIAGERAIMVRVTEGSAGA